MTGAVTVKRMTLVACVGAFALAGCEAQNRIGPPLTSLPRELSVAEQSLIGAGNDFAFRLLRETVAAEREATNIFISPLSVSVALGMTLNGAAGATADSMRATLGFAGMSQADVNAGYRDLIELLSGLDPSVIWSLANSVWYRNSFTFRQTFFDTTRAYFAATVRGLDFSSPSAAPTINGWVNDATHGRITEIVADPIPDSVIMYLINAIFFKGTWTTRFDPARTQPDDFHAAAGAVVRVPMMSNAGTPMRLWYDPGLTVVDLPYARGAYSMTIAMPTGNLPVDSLARSLTRQEWDRWIAGLAPDTMPLYMPKFTFSYEAGLVQPLAALGMGIAFNPARADFSNMTPSSGVFISDVRHKTFVQVDEAGTEAAAVTLVEVSVTSAGPPAEIRIDRPFLFAIRERLSGTILFIGVVRNPAAQN